LDLEKSRDFKLERLQHIKSIIVSVSDIENQNIINQKRKEIKKLQSEIEDIDFEISKLRFK
jgi:PhoPQ-activated pathogenicity-related protein